MTQTMYALANPVSLIVDKPRAQFTREDMIKVIEAKQIERITFHYTALDGKLKELKIPIANRYQAEQVLANGERADGSSLFEGLVDVGLSDLYVVPVYKTAFFNPFDTGSLDFICRYLTSTGDLAPFALDNVLHNAAALFRARTGHEFYAFGELEFFLLSEPENYIYMTPKQRGYHASAPFVKTSRVVSEMVRHITQITGAVKYAHGEVGSVDSLESDLREIAGKQAEQAEIEFLPTPVEDAADNLALARWIVRSVASKYRCVVTFTPKLEEGNAGSGLHIHMALVKDGKNIMADAEGLSDAAQRIIGGLCKYACSLTAFGNTVASSYLRLVPNQEAPTRVCWSDANRSALIRVPLAWAKINNLARKVNPQQKTRFESAMSRQTVELRSPDGSALVHLLLAGITMAAEWGLTHEDARSLAESLYVTGNIFKDKALLDRLDALPKSCVESAQLLQENRALYERDGIFPASVVDYMAKLLQAERDAEMYRYLATLPPNERLHETRRIMHKDLHRH